MTIRDAEVVTCAACDRRFDLNFTKRMRERQEIHALEQIHLAPCSFLQRDFYTKWSAPELYDTPWDKEPRLVYFHNERCEDAYCNAGFGSFQYMRCDSCDRQVCEQNPHNGWHVQFRDHADLGYICLACYQDEILKNGQPRQDFEGASITGGMFFSGGNTEPRDVGYEEAEGFHNYFVSERIAARRFNQHALGLIDAGHKVITAYERMAIGGLEGYVTMMAKARIPERVA